MNNSAKRRKTGNKPADFMLSFADSHIEDLAEELSDSINARKQIRRLKEFVEGYRYNFVSAAPQESLGTYMAGGLNEDAVAAIANNFTLFRESSPIGRLFRKFVPQWALLRNCYDEAQPGSGFVALTMLLELVMLTENVKAAWDLVVAGIENKVPCMKSRIATFELAVNDSMLAKQFAAGKLRVD